MTEGISEKGIPWAIQKYTANLSQLGHIARMIAFPLFRPTQKYWKFCVGQIYDRQIHTQMDRQIDRQTISHCKLHQSDLLVAL